MPEMVLSRANNSAVHLSSQDRALRRALIIAVAVSASYYFTSKIGFAFALQPGSVSVLWMPNSILMAALLLTPRRWWWLVLLGAFPAHLASELQSGVPLGMLLSWFISNSVQALIGALGISYFVGPRLRFDRLRSLTIFIVFGAILAPVLASFLDTALVKLNGWGNSPFWQLWSIRCLSNVLATLTLVPVVILWSVGGVEAIRRAPFTRYVEAGLLMAGLIVIDYLVFSSQHAAVEKTPSLLYWPLPFLLWATVRFGPRGASTSLLVVMFLAISGATHGQGPFLAGSSLNNAVAIQWFLIVISIPVMTLAAVIEERRHAEAAARQNEERLKLALNAARMGAWDWQIHDNSLTWSDDSSRVFSLPLSNAPNTLEWFLNLVHEEDRERVQAAISYAIEHRAPYEIEFRMTSQGISSWVHSMGTVTYDEEGKPFRMFGLAMDITERKRAEEALRQTEIMLARSEAFSLVMVTHGALDGKWIKVPPTLCELLGYTEEELLALSFKDVTHPDDFQADWAKCQRLIRGEIRSYELEKRYLHKDGHTIWVDINRSLVEDDHGNPIHFLTYIKDISYRRLAEQALLESNERNQAILRALPDMMFLHSKDGVFLDYNARDQSALLSPPEEFLGRSVRDVMPADLAERVQECMAKLHAGEETQVLEYSLEIEGALRNYEARLVLAEGDKTLSIVRDVTEQRRAENALRYSEGKLIESNKEIRTLAARLITAQESERRRIALLLHDDVSQRIAALSIGISRLKRRLPTSEEEMRTELDRFGTHLGDLTTQIRRLSHQLHPEVLEHVGLVAALESHVSDFGHEEGIKVAFKSDVQTKPSLDLSNCLYHVAFEAMRNISKHSEAKSASVSLLEDGDFLQLEVSDSGRGFDVERARQGSGIGLISAEERVKLMRGTFEVKSVPMSGTTIVVRIPLGGNYESPQNSVG
jgi:PAS domain S-box-containing protein